MDNLIMRLIYFFTVLLYVTSYSASATSVIVGTPTSANCAPFQCRPDYYAIDRYTQIYDASFFSDAFAISSIEFFKTSPNAELLSFDYEITLSTTNSSSSSYSLNYADNIGSDATLFSSGTFTPSIGEYILFNGIEFDYDPSLGNLLIDMSITNYAGDVSTLPRSLQFSFDTGIQRIYGGVDTGRTGCSSNCGLVTGFNSVATVPIPASIWLFISGAMGIFFRIKTNKD